MLYAVLCFLAVILGWVFVQARTARGRLPNPLERGIKNKNHHNFGLAVASVQSGQPQGPNLPLLSVQHGRDQENSKQANAARAARSIEILQVRPRLEKTQFWISADEDRQIPFVG